MPAELQSLINAMDTKFASVETAFYGLRIGFNWLGLKIAAEDWNECKTTCYLMRDYCRTLQEDFADDNLSVRSNLIDALEYINDNSAFEVEEFEMEMLLSAMVTATPYELKYFIGLVDAYRQSVWNKPFNQEFFAALARSFE